ncbi:MAG: hypothetical protein JO112_03315 [Planctomycetes bacterium]|nr:hypothetical protein [Planctomycetota bacterium]
MVDLCLHIANVCYLLSFLSLDMLWLRLLTCAGLGLGMVFFTCQTTPLYGPAAWHLVFLIINGIQIWRLILVRRQQTLTAEQERLASANFQGLPREELLTLLTRVMCKKPHSLQELQHLGRQPLTPEEQVLRDIAFSRLSRKELLNLLTRRVWNSLKGRRLLRWRRSRRTGPEAIQEGPGGDFARDPMPG